MVSARSWKRAWVGAEAPTAPSSPVTVAWGDKADPARVPAFLLFSCVPQPDCLGSHQPSAAHLRPWRLRFLPWKVGVTRTNVPGGFSESLPVERSGCQPMLSAAWTGVGLGGSCPRGMGGAHSPVGGRGVQMGSCDAGQLGVEWAWGPDGQSSLRSPPGDARQHGCTSEGSLDPAPRRGSPVLMQPPWAMSP